jgi:hypothetical protein
MFEKKFGLGLAGAAALAACSPAEKAPDNAPHEEVIKQVSPDTYEVAEPDVAETVEPTADTPEGQTLARKEAIESGQYTKEQIDTMLSGTTREVDGMSREEIDRLDDSSE